MKNIFGIIAVLSLCISGCTTTQKLDISTTPVEITVSKQPAPRKLNLEDPHFIVITEKNFDEVKAKFADGGKFVVYAVLPTDYKKLIRNQSELKRYISQQKSIIIYYEKISKAK